MRVLAIDPGPTQRKCTACGRTLLLDQFHINRKGRYGRHAECRDCKHDRYVRSRTRAMELHRERRATPEGKERERRWRTEYRQKNRLKRLVQEAKTRARAKGIEFDLSCDDLSIPERCPVLGIQIVVTNARRLDGSPSLDRRDQKLGYVRGNVVVVSWRANRLKSDATKEELRLIVDYMKRGAE